MTFGVCITVSALPPTIMFLYGMSGRIGSVVNSLCNVAFDGFGSTAQLLTSVCRKISRRLASLVGIPNA